MQALGFLWFQKLGCGIMHRRHQRAGQVVFLPVSSAWYDVAIHRFSRLNRLQCFPFHLLRRSILNPTRSHFDHSAVRRHWWWSWPNPWLHLLSWHQTLTSCSSLRLPWSYFWSPSWRLGWIGTSAARSSTDCSNDSRSLNAPGSGPLGNQRFGFGCLCFQRCHVSSSLLHVQPIVWAWVCWISSS